MECRWRRTVHQKWVKGRLDGTLNKDGSVNIVDKKTGGIRSIPLKHIQIKTVGKRGGVKWVPLTQKMLDNLRKNG